MPSIMQRVGTPNPRHNIDNEYRKFLDNVDPKLSKHNAVLQRKSVEEIYAEHLQPAFEAFNNKQRRKDRRLDVKWGVSSALEYQRALDKAAQASKNKIDKKGRPPIREIVWQYGNPEQGYGSLGQTDESRDRIKGMLLEAQEEAQRRYPQLAWGDVAFHADEVSKDAEDKEHGSLHLHASFVPLCYQNKQGPGVQVAFERCLKEMGFSTFEAWKHDLDSIMEDVLHRHGLERTVMGNTEKHRESTEFHRQQRVIRETKELEAKRDAVDLDIILAESSLASIEAQETLVKGDVQQLQEQLLAGKKELSEIATKCTRAEALYDEMQQLNEKNLEIIKENDALIQDQEDALELILDYDQYMDEGDSIVRQLDLLESCAAEMPESSLLFKGSEAQAWIQRMEDLLQQIRETIEAALHRLRIYETAYQVEPDHRISAPLEARSAALDNMITGATQRAKEQQQCPAPRRTGRNDAGRWKDQIWDVHRVAKGHKDDWYADDEARRKARSDAWQRKAEARDLFRSTRPTWEKVNSYGRITWRKIPSKFSEGDQKYAKEQYDAACEEYGRYVAESRLLRDAWKTISAYRDLALEVADDPDAAAEEIERAIDRYRRAVRILERPTHDNVRTMERELHALRKSLELRAEKRKQSPEIQR